MSPDALHDQKSPWPKFPNWLVNLAALGFVASLIAGAYSLGKDIGEKELSDYKLAQQIDFPKLTDDAREATSALNRAASGFEQLLANTKTYNELVKQSEADRKNAVQLQTELNNASSQLSASRQKLKETEALLARELKKDQTVVLRDGQAVQFGKDLNIGVSGQFDNWAYLSINGNTLSVNAGYNGAVKDLKDRACRITVIRSTKADGTELSANCDTD
jgi:hypothetical protein